MFVVAEDDGGRFEEGSGDGGFARRIGETELEAGFFYVLDIVSGKCDYFIGARDGGEELDGIQRRESIG